MYGKSEEDEFWKNRNNSWDLDRWRNLTRKHNVKWNINELVIQFVFHPIHIGGNRTLPGKISTEVPS